VVVVEVVVQRRLVLVLDRSSYNDGDRLVVVVVLVELGLLVVLGVLVALVVLLLLGFLVVLVVQLVLRYLVLLVVQLVP